MTVSLKVNRKNWDSIKSRLQSLGNKEVQVGFFNKVYPGIPTNAFPDGYNEGVQVAQVAYWNNVGTNDSPPRPFMEDTVESRETHKNLEIFVREALKKNKALPTLLNELGKREAELMQTIIEDYDQKSSNSPDWIAEKGFDDALQYTDFMLKSVEFRVKSNSKV